VSEVCGTHCVYDCRFLCMYRVRGKLQGVGCNSGPVEVGMSSLIYGRDCQDNRVESTKYHDGYSMELGAVLMAMATSTTDRSWARGICARP
jgi:hypothetical protein